MADALRRSLRTNLHAHFGNQTASSGPLTNPFQYTARENDTETGLYCYRARYYDGGLGRFISEDPIRFWGGNDFYEYVLDNPVSGTDALGLTDYNEQQTQQLLQAAYNSATAGYFRGLWNIRNNSQGGGPYDFAHDPNGIHQADTWTLCGVKMSAGDFGNFIAGFQGGAWDGKHYWYGAVSPVAPPPFFALGAVVWAGIYYHSSGQSDVKNDPWDMTGQPWIYWGAFVGWNFEHNGGKCECQ